MSGRVQVGVTAGVLSHSLLGTVSGRLLDVGAGLNIAAEVEAERAVSVGGLLGLRLSRSVSFFARIETASTHMRLVVLASPVNGPGFQRFTFEGLGDVKIWSADAELRWAPLSGEARASPYLLAGLGASGWNVSGLEDLGSLPPLLQSPVNLNPIIATTPGLIAGAGIAVSLTGPLNLSLQISDRVSPDPIADDDFRLGSSFEGEGQAKDLVHSLTLSAGLSLSLGR